MKFPVWSAVLLAGVLWHAQGVAAENEGDLYKRMGGYDKVAAVMDDFIGRMATDNQLNKYFVGHSQDSLQKLRQLMVDQVANLAGGPALYTGRSMEVSHKGMGITEAEWNASVQHMNAALDAQKVAPKEKQEFMNLIQELKDGIVEPKGKAPQAAN